MFTQKEGGNNLGLVNAYHIPTYKCTGFNMGIIALYSNDIHDNIKHSLFMYMKNSPLRETKGLNIPCIKKPWYAKLATPNAQKHLEHVLKLLLPVTEIYMPKNGN